MIRIENKANCCGCSACIERCPKQCITLAEDNEGFSYPSVDHSKCIECGLCESVCPFIHTQEARLPIKVLAAINKDEQIRLGSSSGGLFSSIATQIIKQGGVVFGARFDKDWLVNIGFTETIEGLSAFRGSKYLQARIGNSFVECEEFLKSGRKVLFSGSPCQIAGLKRFLHCDYENLITVDFVCHGVPSPKVWKLYLKEVLAAVNEHKNLFDYKFSYSECKNGIFSIVSPFNSNDYMKAFLKDLILRPSCYHCKVREGRSMSDITIGDYWGIQNACPNMDDNKGTSLALLHSTKGLEILNFTDCMSMETTFEDATASNPAIISSPHPCKTRDSFFIDIDKPQSIIKLIRKNVKTNVSLWRRIHNTAHIIKIKAKMVSYPTKDIYSEEKVDPFSISFRSKENGWKEYQMKIDFKISR